MESLKIAMHSGDSMMTESGDMFRSMKGFTVAIVRIMLPLVRLSRYDSFRPDIILEDGRARRSVEKLRTLEIRIVYPGHGKPFQMEQFKESSQ